MGARAFLVGFPAFLVASTAVTILGTPPLGGRDAQPSWRWVGGAALVVAIGSLLGLPPGGGFPARG